MIAGCQRALTIRNFSRLHISWLALNSASFWRRPLFSNLFCYPAMTTVHIPRDQIGQNICDVLIPNEETRLEHEILIDPELVLRGSTGPPLRP